MVTHEGKGGVSENYAPTASAQGSPNSSELKHAHGTPEVVRDIGNTNFPEAAVTSVDELEASKKGRFAYFKTKEFYIVLVLGYVSDSHVP